MSPSKLEVYVSFSDQSKCYTFEFFKLTWPMAKLYTFGDYIFSRENKVQTFILGFHSLSELRVVF